MSPLVRPEVPGGTYKVAEQVAQHTRWRYRYCSELKDYIAYFTGAPDASNLARSFKVLCREGVLAVIEIPRPSGGRPLTPRLAC